MVIRGVSVEKLALSTDFFYPIPPLLMFSYSILDFMRLQEVE